MNQGHEAIADAIEHLAGPKDAPRGVEAIAMALGLERVGDSFMGSVAGSLNDVAQAIRDSGISEADSNAHIAACEAFRETCADVRKVLRHLFPGVL